MEGMKVKVPAEEEDLREAPHKPMRPPVLEKKILERKNRRSPVLWREKRV
jgi:hypothetical protein